MTRSAYTILILVVGLVGLSNGRANAQSQTCKDFIGLAQEGVPPEVGDAGKMGQMLTPTVAAPQLGKAFSPKMALKAVGDRGLSVSKSSCPNEKPGTSARGKTTMDENTDPLTEQKCDYRNKKGSLLRVNLAEGEFAYLNPLRRFDVFKGADNRIMAGQAAEKVREAAIGAGVPGAELDSRNMEVRSLMLAGQVRDERQNPGEVHRAEVHVRFPRHVGGVPVFDSSLQAAIDVNGMVARMHVRWPDFSLIPGLTPSATLPRSAVVQDVVEALGAEHLCGSLSRIEAHIAYVRAAEVAASDSRDEQGAGAPEDRRSFVPALVVYAVPVEPKEDSGEIAMGAQQLTLPLLQLQRADMASSR